ncbi:MAG TPA: TRAP transporter large permease [Usitatibacter sp.]|nr:TRAP transporter large permease [Usitatibacter sp.]
MAALAITLLMIALLAMGMPVGFALAAAGVAGLFYTGGLDMVLGILQTEPLTVASSYELVTVPMFLLMAEFIILSRIADDLFETASKFVGHVPGGLGISTAIAGAGFAAISGSSTASAATLSAACIPAMIRQKYEPRMAYGVVAISGTLAMLIPPSIAIVLYAIIAGESIGPMLIAGVIPGLLVTLTIALTVVVLVLLDRSRAPLAPRASWRERIASLKVTGPMIALIVLVTGVIYLGIATPTEASALGAFGAFVLALRAGKIDAASLGQALSRAAGSSCMILAIILGAKIFGYFFTMTRATNDIVALISSMDLNRYVVLSLILGMYLVLGCILDQVAILILTVPVVLPVVKALGFDPMWFGIVVIVMAEVGMVTPPVGLNVYVVARANNRPASEIFAGVGPHVLAHLILVALLVAFPALVLWLPATIKS